jgi:hypothetical protein
MLSFFEKNSIRQLFSGDFYSEKKFGSAWLCFIRNFSFFKRSGSNESDGFQNQFQNADGSDQRYEIEQGRDFRND